MTLCAVHDRQDRQETARRARIRAEGSTSRALCVFDEEHMWRIAGEQAIRDEMERRVTIWLAKRRRM